MTGRHDGTPRDTAQDEPVRVLRVIARLNMGGPALHVAYLTAGLASRGYDTTLVAGSLARGEDSMAFVADELGLDVYRIDELHRDISPVRDVVAALRLARLIRRERPQILHTHTAKAGAVGRVAALLAGRARPPIVVHTFHGHVLRGYFDPVRTAGFQPADECIEWCGPGRQDACRPHRLEACVPAEPRRTD